MEKLFIGILNMSIASCILILFVILIRLIFRRAPKAFLCILWAFVGLRLICPFTLQSAVCLIPDSQSFIEDFFWQENNTLSQTEISDDKPELSQDRTHKTNEEYENKDSGMNKDHTAKQDEGSRGYAHQVQESTPENEKRSDNMNHNSNETSFDTRNILLSVFSYIWVLAAMIIFVSALIRYFMLIYRLRGATADKRGFYYSDRIETPFILGILRPRIYLPEETEDSDLEYIIEHERAHLRRLDHIWKPIGFFILCLHWFNPLAWVAYFLFCKDTELACDEKVVHDYSFEKRKEYSRALINCSERKNPMDHVTLAFGESGVKERVINVLSYKKPTLWVIIICILAAAGISIFLMTKPAAHDDWQMVKLGSHNTIKVPSEWVVTEIDGVMYFSNKPLDEKDVTIYMFQSFSDAGNQDDIGKYGEESVNGIIESNQLCKSFQAKYDTYTEGYSNGAYLGTAVVSIDESLQTASYIYLSDIEPEIFFYVWENNVDSELLKKIANTYDGYTPDKSSLPVNDFSDEEIITKIKDSIAGEAEKNGGIIDLIVWCSDTGGLKKDIIGKFKKKFKDDRYEFNIRISTNYGFTKAAPRLIEGTEKTVDVFETSDGYLSQLVGKGLIAKVDPMFKNNVIIQNTESSIKSCMVHDELYAFPESDDDHCILFYDKRVFNASDVDELDKMIDIAGKNNTNVYFPLTNAYFNYSFFSSAGCDISYDSATDEQTFYVDNENGFAAARAMCHIAERNGAGFLGEYPGDSLVISYYSDGSISAAVCDTNFYTELKTAWGEENIGAAKLPTALINGKQVQLESFGGYILAAVNAGSKCPFTAQALEYFMTNTDSQNEGYVKLEALPTNISVLSTERAVKDTVIGAVQEQKPYSHSHNKTVSEKKYYSEMIIPIYDMIKEILAEDGNVSDEFIRKSLKEASLQPLQT